MGVKNFFKSLFGVDFYDEKQRARALEICEEKRQILAIRQLAYEICIKRIAKVLSKVEFQTFEKNAEVKKSLYYRLNVEPNPNQSATQFWESVVHALYTDQEALIYVSTDDGIQLYLADSYSVDDSNAFYEHTFSDVTIGDYKLKRKLRSSDVIYLKLEDDRVKSLLAQTMDGYGELITAAYKAYKLSNGNKYKMSIDRNREMSDDQLQDLLDNDVKTFVNSDSAVFPEYEGYNLQPLETGKSGTTRDIKALLDDQIEYTCKALLIPTNIMTGQVTDTSRAMDDFLTFCLDSLVELIQDELNRKLYGEAKYLKGNFVQISTQAIKHIDILDMAGAVDKLLSSGVMTINDINRLLRRPVVEDDWADKHYMTKNYMPIEQMLDEIENGKEETTNAENESIRVPVIETTGDT